jgi:hypothetical protein
LGIIVKKLRRFSYYFVYDDQNHSLTKIKIMKNRYILSFSATCLILGLSACNTTTQTLSNDIATLGNSIFGNINTRAAASSALSQRDISTAFKQALTIGTQKVVGQLSKANGFNADPKIHIPLPSTLSKVQGALNAVGASYLLDDLETKLNRAAELATPHAKELFINAISEMTFDDIYNIYTGPQDSATTFFRSKMSAPLASKMSPFVNNAIAQAGVINSYDKVINKYQAIPFMPDVKADLTSYVVNQGIEGIFFYLAEQEKAIRQDPIRQTTDLLKKVFGNQIK